MENQEQSIWKRADETNGYCRTKMQKELILEKIKEKGFRLTRQRRILLDIILEHDCSSCKEIYYQAAKIDHEIGIATVYRIVNMLEEIGALSRGNMYKIDCSDQSVTEKAYVIEFEDNTTCHLSVQRWNEVIRMGLKATGCTCGRNIKSIAVKECEKL